MRRLRERYGRWALVAGASEGLGAEFSRALAAQGLDVLLVARRAGPLEALAAELRAEHGVEARALARDLTKPDELEALVREVAGLELGLLVCNAALSPIGEFLARPIAEHRALLDLNCRAPMELVHALAPQLVSRGRGGIVIMSSLAGLQGTALTAHYSASKAWLRVLAEGLWAELGPRGVDVTCCLAGPTETPTWRSTGAVRPLDFPPVQQAREVVDATLAALGKSPAVVPSRFNRAVDLLMRRVLPTSMAVRLVSSTTRRMYR